MCVFTYSESRKRLAEVLDMAEEDEVIIRRRNGDAFSLTEVRKKASPLDIDGVEVDVTLQELAAAVRESRERQSKRNGLLQRNRRQSGGRANGNPQALAF